MESPKQFDDGFEAFRRERAQEESHRGKDSEGENPQSQVCREIEQVEARERHQQQLSREVHEFFAAATNKAASLVEKVSSDAAREAGQRLQSEVDEFLLDAKTRMNELIVAVMQQRRDGTHQARSDIT